MSSAYKLFAIGTVAEDLIVGEKSIKVMLHEIMSNVDGEIGNDDIINKNITSSDGRVYAVNMNSSGTVPAIWLNNNSNRVTPPNVRKGEKVEVYKYADSDKYYWKTMGTELDLRRLEHVKWVFVNTNIEGETKIDDSNSYSFTASTLNKFMGMHTAANNGEITTFDVGIDTKEGIVFVRDGRGNLIELQSAEDRFIVKVNNIVDIIGANEANITTSKATIKADTLTIMTDKTSINP